MNIKPVYCQFRECNYSHIENLSQQKGISSSELKLLLREMKYKAKIPQIKNFGTNTYVNYRAKIKHILSFCPWLRLPNRQNHVDLRSFLSTLIIWTHRGNVQQNLFLFHYFKVNIRRQLAGWGDYYQLFPGQSSISFLRPRRSREKRPQSLWDWIKASADWPFTWLWAQNDSLLSASQDAEGVPRLVLSPAGMTQKHPPPCLN